MGELFGSNDLIIQWTTSHGLTSHHWRIPLMPLAVLGYVAFVFGVQHLRSRA